MRVPVVDKDHKPLMPTKPSRVRRWLKSGKAVKRWSDIGMFYVQLTVDPSDTETQPVALGIDPGKLYSGIGVQSTKATLFMAHLVLPFQRVKKRMETRAMMRRTRRGRRIKRFSTGKVRVPFKLRNHRQERYSNRRKEKLPPSIRSNRQLELRMVDELQKILPITKIVYEVVKAKGNSGFSPVMVGQKWMVRQLEGRCATETRFGYDTFNIRHRLGLEKSRHKSDQVPETHAVDGVALACSEFICYNRKYKQASWEGDVVITPSVFTVIRRPPYSRRQLHLLQFSRGGKRRAYGGSVICHRFRKGDLVRACNRNRTVVGYVSGGTQRQVSVSDTTWKRLGQFTASKVELLKRSTGLVVNRFITSLVSAC